MCSIAEIDGKIKTYLEVETKDLAREATWVSKIPTTLIFPSVVVLSHLSICSGLG